MCCFCHGSEELSHSYFNATVVVNSFLHKTRAPLLCAHALHTVLLFKFKQRNFTNCAVIFGTRVFLILAIYFTTYCKLYLIHEIPLFILIISNIPTLKL
jgi:hypothetical protein